jgi:hypothetical protein
MWPAGPRNRAQRTNASKAAITERIAWAERAEKAALIEDARGDAEN